MNHWKIKAILILSWLWMAVYVTYHNTLRSSEFSDKHRTDENTFNALDSLEKLKSHNQELQEIITKLRINGSKNVEATLAMVSDRKDVEQDFSKMTATLPSPLNFEVEKARRKAENTARELWYYLNAQLKKIADSYKVSNMLEELTGYRRTLEADLKQLREADKAEEKRQANSEALGDLVQRRLQYLQNPPDCETAKKLVCDLHTSCGFGCQIHHLTYCLVMAYGMQRTLILDSTLWDYSAKGWESVFQPLSQTCRHEGNGTRTNWIPSMESMEKYEIIVLPVVTNLHPRPDFLPLAVPADLKLDTFHGDPPVWWIGQMVQYLFRPNAKLQQDIESTSKKMGFRNTIVGVHVRRTDKINLEAAFHSLDEYMKHVEDFYFQLERHQNNTIRRVYLASDDPTVLTEAKEKDMNNIEEYYNNAAFGKHSNRFCCCQVCRVAYEIMQTFHGDASQNFKSLDDSYYFHGQSAHNMKVLESHSRKGLGDIDIKPGDAVGIAGNHWDGYSKGVNRRTGVDGLYPSYKVENTVVAVSMPTYPEVPWRKKS